MKNHQIIKTIFVIVIAAICLQSNSFAQVASRQSILKTKITGMVKDDHGGLLPKAVVTFKNKQFKGKVVSADDGTFEIYLPAGKYRVIAKSEGCHEFQLKEWIAQFENPTNLDIIIKCSPTPIYE